MMAEIADFLCRVNYEIPYGNFEPDMTDGEVRFRCFVDCDGIIPTNAMVKTASIVPRECSNTTVQESLISSSEMQLPKKRLRSAKKKQRLKCALS